MPRPMVAETLPIKPVRLILGLIACLGLVFTIFTLLFGFTSIPANSVGVKTRFGAYHDIVNPGLAYAIPYIDEIHVVPTQRLLKLEFGFTTSNVTNIYQGDMEPEETETMMTGDLTVDEVLTVGRHDIESSTLKRLADLCSQYGLGIQIQQVQLATVRPPPVVQAAFNEVNQAQQEKQTAINQAWAVYNDAVPNARGQAKEREKQAEAYAFRRVNEAKGETQKFSLLLAEYRKAPEVTRRRLYLEALQAILRILFILTALKWGTLLFVVHQYENVIITRFGKIVRTVTNPGLKIKLPVIDKVHRFDKRILAWDGPPTECPTKDKLYIIVDCFARWRISDPFLYYNRLNDERSALSRLDDILGSETRTAVAAHDLVEIIRVTKGRKPLHDEELEKSGTVLPSTIPEIELGRGEIEKQITERTRQKISDFGIELLDERFKRSKYNPAVAEKIIERMSSERHQIAARFRSEGRGEAANINGQKESDVASISSTATKIALETEGKADAEAASIYAAAFNPPDAQELYSFLRSLDVMRAAFEKDTTAVLSTNSDLGRMLK